VHAVRIFDPYAFLDDESRPDVTAKVANLAKVGLVESETLATLAALAGARPESERLANRQERNRGTGLREHSNEHDGKIPRAWSEGFARLHPDRPPGDVWARRRVRFIDDVGLFLDSPFSAVAAALGWGPYDLFGCDRDRPFARIDRAGLLWFLNGDKLIALSENTAKIERRTGAQ
jgi:hypothetical protein